MKSSWSLIVGVIAGLSIGIGAMWILGGGSDETPEAKDLPEAGQKPPEPTRKPETAAPDASPTPRDQLKRSLRKAANGDGPGMDELLRLLRIETDPQVRSLIYAAIGASGDQAMVARLLEAYRTEEDHRLQYSALEAAALLGGPAVEAVLKDVLATPLEKRTDLLFRDLAATNLVRNGDAASLEYLKEFILGGAADSADDPLYDGRAFVLHEMGQHGGSAHAETLADIAADTSLGDDLRIDAVNALSNVRGEEASLALRDLLDVALATEGELGGRGDVRMEILQALGSRRDDPEAEATLRDIAGGATNAPNSVRSSAVRSLGAFSSDESVKALLNIARNAETPGLVRNAAWISYSQAGGASAVEELVREAIQGEDAASRYSAVKALDFSPPKVRREALERVATQSQDKKVIKRAQSQLE